MKNKDKPKPKKKVVGVCLGWDGYLHLSWDEGTYIPCDRELYPEYWIEGQEWPVDPITKEKLPIASFVRERLKKEKRREIFKKLKSFFSRRKSYAKI